MIWTVALCVFFAQLLCCIYGRSLMGRYMPVLICGASLLFTALAAPGAIGVVLLAVEGLSTLMALLAIGLYKLVLWTKK